MGIIQTLVGAWLLTVMLIHLKYYLTRTRDVGLFSSHAIRFGRGKSLGLKKYYVALMGQCSLDLIQNIDFEISSALNKKNKNYL